MPKKLIRHSKRKKGSKGTTICNMWLRHTNNNKNNNNWKTLSIPKVPGTMPKRINANPQIRIKS